MYTLTVNSSRKYDIVIGKGFLKNAGEMLSKMYSGRKIVFVSDDNVYPLYGDLLKNSLEKNGFETYSFVFKNGEESKNLNTFSDLLVFMCDKHITRKDMIVALGGGVVGDLAGFAAATYQRGIEFIQMPTSLLAAVDSSVGGKTAVDLPNGKNQVGCFYQPSLVACDIDTLKTLPYDEYVNGCAEIIKYGMLSNIRLLNSIYEKPVSEQYEQIIYECVKMKAAYVEEDEYDTGSRMMLNFGHTIGHAVETCSKYSISHGKAVAIGMAVITKAACEKGICQTDTYDKLVNLLKKYDLPIFTEYTSEQMVDTILSDKKTAGKQITLVLPSEYGKCFLQKTETSDLKEWLTAGGIR